ncbi:MAG: non-heme iron oxygenase ferredoxin subunit [Pseudonocardia sp.]|uniref:Rieske (2Fe-2S) protein n=1 Tax=unclassified Pseudonocardia TaxID=2619320 RepID=UPI00086F61A1|nr:MULTISPECIES: non-heme iron oxygenase ferredoxin subunit [unclassified Pseudonocardia]MBN9112024.1 non-heme iron oxygenase ferredoxin subunit [Pseudonocardia sp.]ODU25992.1 MAG: Rieske (2Fe-2S) protein [Pseudonocardia sp. SCN 72-51]ODV06052.1 MAG: Rieske (2Fe-2S) protein [Pseudonocardia sp. SCN 73-27]RTL69659.1 MAG: non-heme iron oxygenase ferredoxin subunit [Pseudonocardiaceae bacterium]
MAWEAVADLDQLEEGDMMVVEMKGEPICVVRLYEDEAVAVHNTCTHQQQPLNEGYLQEDDTLICPAHNSCFDLRTGEPRGVPAVSPIPVYACKIEDDAIWVDADQQLNDAEIPHKPFH